MGGNIETGQAEVSSSPRFRFSYHVDWLVIAMIVAAILDILTTYYGLSWYPAREGNPVLGPLLEYSFGWLPVYCFARPLLVPLLPEVPLRTSAIYYLFVHLYGGINNSLAMLIPKFSLVNAFGYWPPLILCYLGIVGIFIWQLVRRKEDRWFQFVWSAVALLAFTLIEGVFYLLGVLG